MKQIHCMTSLILYLFLTVRIRMYDLNKFIPIIYHLKNISSIFEDKGNHYQIFCPFCNDSTRRHNPTHGHCYVSKELPVYYCHRCGASGTILSLLIYTDFKDVDTINSIKQFVKYNFVKDHLYNTTPKTISTQQTHQFIKSKIYNMGEYELDLFENYIYSRLGEVNYSRFLIYPDHINISGNESADLLSVCFNNNHNQFIESRFVNPIGKIRYKKNNKNFQYFFQEWDFENVNNIIITEGVFDILNIYLYNNIFERHSFYLSMGGKKYLGTIESLLYQELLFGEYQINLIFDNDNKYIIPTLLKCKRMIGVINNNITLKGWTPIQTLNDVGDYPALVEVLVPQYNRW